MSRPRLLAAATVLPVVVLAVGALAAPAATAATAAVPVGLFGTQDPTYNGVFRQSLALLALTGASATVPPSAVEWLASQQCADGGFEAFRADTSVACTPSDAATFSGPDTNSTGLAVAALRAVGRTAAADRALAWLRSTQDADGGFPYYVGAASDPNSTGMALVATNAYGLAPGQVVRGTSASAAAYLASVQVGCAGAAQGQDGGIGLAPGDVQANDMATAQAGFGLTGAPLPFRGGAGTTDKPRLTCPTSLPSDPAPPLLVAGYLARLVDTYGAVPNLDWSTSTRQPGTIDLSSTGWAVLTLAAAGVGSAERDTALGALLTALGTAPAATTPGAVSPEDAGHLAIGLLAAHAAGTSPATVSALAARLLATLTPAPSASPTPSATHAASAANGELSPTGATPLTPVLAALGALLVLAGGLAVASTRERGAHA